MNKVNLYGYIPASVRYDKRLAPIAKLLYAEITACSNFDGLCEEDIHYFSKVMSLDVRTIFRHLAVLEEASYIERIKKNGSRHILLPLGYDKAKTPTGVEAIPADQFTDELMAFFERFIKRFEEGLETTISKPDMYYGILYDRLTQYSQNEMLEALENRINFINNSEWHQANKANISDITLLIGDNTKLQKWLNTKIEPPKNEKLKPLKFE